MLSASGWRRRPDSRRFRPRKTRTSPATKPIRELLEVRKGLLLDWEKVNKERAEVENPERSPEREAAEFKAERDKTRTLLEQSAKAPDALLPEVFRAKEADAKGVEGRLNEMKEAIDAARNELKDRSAELEKLRVDGSGKLASEVAALRAERDKIYQGVAALTAGQGERQAGVAAATSPEARDLAKERLTNFEWEARVRGRAARLHGSEDRPGEQAARPRDLPDPGQGRPRPARQGAPRTDGEPLRRPGRAATERPETGRRQGRDPSRDLRRPGRAPQGPNGRPSSLEAGGRRSSLTRRIYATSAGVSLQEQTALADATNTNFAELKKLVDDGNVSPLDALRLKNDFRRITPERAQIVRTDLADTEAELTTYENALTDAEIDLVNDSRDDRFDRESLLEQLPAEASRRGERDARRAGDPAQGPAQPPPDRAPEAGQTRAEDAHNQVLRRIKTLDEQYAFIRTHIFWIRDAEPLGAATVAHARDDLVRTAKALVRLTIETRRPHRSGAASRPISSSP